LKQILYSRGFINGLMDASEQLDLGTFKRIIEPIFQAIDNPDSQKMLQDPENRAIVLAQIDVLGNEAIIERFKLLIYALSSGADYNSFLTNEGAQYEEVSDKLDLIYNYGYFLGAINMHFFVLQDQNKYQEFLQEFAQANKPDNNYS
jgi:hypothetical protein